MSRIWVERVSPVNLHRFKEGQIGLKGLREGFNLIFASNAAGKSTLAKSIQGLLQPDLLDSGTTVVALVHNGALEESVSRRRKDARFAGFPGKASDYYLDLPSLLHGQNARVGIEKILGTGYAVQPPRRTSKADPTVEEAKRALVNLVSARQVKQNLLRDEQSLVDAEERFKQSLRASQTTRDLRNALKWLQAGQRERGLQSQIDALLEAHPGLERLLPDTAGELKQMELKLAVELERLEAGRVALYAIADSRPLLPPRGSDLERLGECTAKWREARLDVERLGSEIGECEAQLAQSAARIWAISPGEGLIGTDRLVDAEAFELLSQVAAAKDEDRKRRGKLESIERALGTVPQGKEVEAETLDATSRGLIAWIRSRSVEPKPDWVPLVVLAVAAFAAAVISTAMVRVGIVVVGTVGGSALLLSRKPRSPEGEMVQLAEPFACPNPDPESVARVLERVGSARAQLDFRKSLEGELAALEAPSDEVERTIERSGLRCNDAYRLATVADLVRNHTAVQLKLDRARGELEVGRNTCEACRLEVGGLFARYGFAPAHLTDQCDKEFREWHQREQEFTQLERNCNGLRQEIDAFLDRSGIPKLEEGVSRAQVFRDRLELAGRVQSLRRDLLAVNAERGALFLDADRFCAPQGCGEGVRLEELDEPTVQRWIEDHEQLAEQCETRQGEVDELRACVREASRQDQLAEAETKYRKALGLLEASWEASSRESIRRQVGDYIQKRLMQEDLPALMQRANARLFRFSQRRYRLVFGTAADSELGPLTVKDLLNGSLHPFSELSGGSKVHVLLAVKIALIEEQELNASSGATVFPLIADEPLAVSDRESSDAVAEILVELSRERQVIVFTNQHADVTLFRGLLPQLEVLGVDGEVQEVSDVASVQLSRTKLAPVSKHFDPRFPVGAQALGALAGSEGPESLIRIDHLGEQHPMFRAARDLDRVRQELNAAFPRLEWSEFEGESWAKGIFSDRLRAIVEETQGCPHRFAKQVAASKSKAFRQPFVEEAMEWLGQHGYLVPAPDAEWLDQMVQEALYEWGELNAAPIKAAFRGAYCASGSQPTARDRVGKAPTGGLFQESPV